MISEKMKILKMLEEGRISAGDAEKMLNEVGKEAAVTPVIELTIEPPDMETLDIGPVPSLGYPASAGFTSFAHNGERPEPPKPLRRMGKPDAQPAVTQAKGGSTSEDISHKMETLFEKMERKLQRVAEAVVEKTGNAITRASGKAAKPVVEKDMPFLSKMPAQQPKAATPRILADKPTTRKLRSEIKITQTVAVPGSELILDGLHGDMHIKGYNGDKITATVSYTQRRGNSVPELAVLGNKYYLSYDDSEIDSVSVDAYIPAYMFSSVRLSNDGATIVLAQLEVSELRVESQGGDVEITDVKTENLLAETINGTMRLSNISADRAAVDNFNGAINAVNVDAAQMKMTAINFGINLQMAQFSNYRNYTWGVEANNGKLNLVLPSSVDVGYHISATAALSDVRIGLTGVSYISRGASTAEVQSANFDIAPRKVTMLLESSNAPVVVS
ncbi:MAG: DUF4097 domain-containing protein [Defluviitaleaceae bacterium]|nr:DUF4097 domain-containing protein [Defluviitaleaceae bacterium]